MILSGYMAYFAMGLGLGLVSAFIGFGVGLIDSFYFQGVTHVFDESSF